MRFGWGRAAASALAAGSGALVVVDVLSWSTATAIAVGRGTSVVPHGWPGPAQPDLPCAVPRRAVCASSPWSLSPRHLLAAPAPARLVLPSPNGSAIAAAATSAPLPPAVVAGCLRNASSVARWLSARAYGTPDRPVTVVAAGERWPDGSLRPCLEDLYGAGAVIAGLDPTARRSPEAAATEDAWLAGRAGVASALRRCESGTELAGAGYGGDVSLAADVDAQGVVPVVEDGAFVDAADRPAVRPATPGDAEAERNVERAAGARFSEVGMADVADHEPMPVDRLAAYASAGRGWVAVDEAGRVIGYVVADVVDGCGHVEQLSVDPPHQGQGIGRALLGAVERWAAGEGLAAMTLSTFTAVAWNRPLYEHLGWTVIAPGELTPGLEALRAEEAAAGLDPSARVCMRRSVGT